MADLSAEAFLFVVVASHCGFMVRGFSGSVWVVKDGFPEVSLKKSSIDMMEGEAKRL